MNPSTLRLMTRLASQYLQVKDSDLGVVGEQKIAATAAWDYRLKDDLDLDLVHKADCGFAPLFASPTLERPHGQHP